MSDKFSKETRSKIMSQIKGKDTKPEIILRKALFKKGYRYSLKHRFKELNFVPDIVMPSHNLVIFVDGCFWHRCPKCYKAPRTNKKYWIPKLERNVLRDKKQTRYLKKEGWKVVRVWEHEITKELERILNTIEDLSRLD